MLWLHPFAIKREIEMLTAGNKIYFLPIFLFHRAIIERPLPQLDILGYSEKLAFTKK